MDWLLFFPDWGRTDCIEPETEPCECDLNEDGSCNGLDWLLFYPDWGRTDCPIRLDDGLVAYYPFNGNANDESGNGNHGTVQGAMLTADRFGNPDSAYSFDGVDDYIGLANTSVLNFTSGGFTLVAWVNFTADNWDQGIVSKHVCGYGNGYFLGVGYWDGGGDYKNRFNFFVNNDTRLMTSEIYNDGTWHFVVGVYDDVNQYLYVDGVLGPSQPESYDNTNEIEISIGKHSCAGSTFTGKIDDVRIYNRALSADEIQALYNLNN